ncbi:MAG: thioesterase family protein [Wenzhouxiangellaceae bacterium]|nr:thioesterase family protein [Wenzhouxiangellaceae bacterium]
MSEFSISIEVRWGDVDSFGHVNNAVFLSYLEQCRSEWMSSVPSHWQDGDTGPVVAAVHINYRRPLYWPGQAVVTLKPASPGRSSIKLESEIRSAPDESGKTVQYADATVTLVWIEKKSGESVPLPSAIRELAKGV